MQGSGFRLDVNTESHTRLLTSLILSPEAALTLTRHSGHSHTDYTRNGRTDDVVYVEWTATGSGRVLSFVIGCHCRTELQRDFCRTEAEPLGPYTQNTYDTHTHIHTHTPTLRTTHTRHAVTAMLMVTHTQSKYSKFRASSELEFRADSHQFRATYWYFEQAACISSRILSERSSIKFLQSWQHVILLGLHDLFPDLLLVLVFAA